MARTGGHCPRSVLTGPDAACPLEATLGARRGGPGGPACPLVCLLPSDPEQIHLPIWQNLSALLVGDGWRPPWPTKAAGLLGVRVLSPGRWHLWSPRPQPPGGRACRHQADFGVPGD